MVRTNFFSEGTWAVEGAKGLLLCIVAMAALLLGLFAMAEPAHAATTFTVNSTGDENDLDFPGGAFDGSSFNTCDVNSVTVGNQCTLRAAIQQANVTTGADTIAFNISGDGPHTISPNSVLPTITQELTIDGYTQGDSTTGTTADDAVENTTPLTDVSTNAVLKIELDGSNAGTGSEINGLTTGATRAVVKGLVINRFEDAGIRIDNGDARIEGNFIGTNPAGDTARGNGGGGIVANPVYNSGIGPRFFDTTVAQQKAARNLISGNGDDGVLLGSSGPFLSSSNYIRGNLIGTAADGTSALPNAGDGVQINADTTSIGDFNSFRSGSTGPVVSSGAGRSINVIAHNGGRGIAVVGGALNTILDNLIFSNDGLGIDLVGGTETNSVTQNDPQDPDLGANNLQNYPRLLTATSDDASTTITGELNSKPNQQFNIQFFSSAQADPSEFGEGEELLGQQVVNTNGTGKTSFTFTVNQDLHGKFVTATADFYGVVEGSVITELGGTSEFSGAVQVTQGPPTSEGPTISDIADQTIEQDTNTGPIPFTVGDADTLAATLEVSGTSSNTTLVPNANIVFGGSGENRTVTVTPAAGEVGTASVTVKVNDGTAEAIDTFVLTVQDTTAPTVESVSPADTATGFSPTASVEATFSETMISSTINGSTFSLTKPDGTDADTNPDPVAGVVNYDSAKLKATFDPTADLDYSTTYTATVTTGAEDRAGNQLDQDPNTSGNQPKTWSFTTAAAPPPDTSSPTVEIISPLSGATNVLRTTMITAQFSEDVNGATVRADTFMLGKGQLSSSQLTDATRIRSGTAVSYEPATKTAKLDPYGSKTTTLARCQWYTAKVTSGVKDKAGNPVVEKLWYFQTEGKGC